MSTSHKKPRPATSVSLIFAQPLQSSPLRSAIDNLPTVAGVDDTTSLTDGMSRKSQRARGESVASTVTSIPGSVDHRQANPDKDRSSIHDADNHTTPPDDVNDASTNAPVIIDLTEDGEHLFHLDGRVFLSAFLCILGVTTLCYDAKLSLLRATIQGTFWLTHFWSIIVKWAETKYPIFACFDFVHIGTHSMPRIYTLFCCQSIYLVAYILRLPSPLFRFLQFHTLTLPGWIC